MMMAELRERTKDLHRRTESAVDLLNRLSSIDSYIQLLSRFHGLYSPLESRIESAAQNQAIDFNLVSRRKSHLLVEDLITLGQSEDVIRRIPICPQLPDLTIFDRALGCLYVLEGSTLGGQIICREVHNRLGLTAETGCRFFTGYGERTASTWREFCNWVDSYSQEHPDARENMILAAEETFRRFGEWIAC